jgi:hypothetical protein
VWVIYRQYAASPMGCWSWAELFFSINWIKNGFYQLKTGSCPNRWKRVKSFSISCPVYHVSFLFLFRKFGRYKIRNGMGFAHPVFSSQSL